MTPTPTHKEVSRRGGLIGGKATGARKRRSPEHYARMRELAALARKGKREGKV